MTRTIPLTQGKVALVDDADYEWLSQFKWCANHVGDGQFYAQRGFAETRMYMHRQILGAPPGTLCDHVNGNGLDNRRQNLRLASASQNNSNVKARSNNQVGLKGVYRHGRRWKANIRANGKMLHLGVFDTPEEAAHAYDAAALDHFGEFARLNFQSGGPRRAVSGNGKADRRLSRPVGSLSPE